MFNHLKHSFNDLRIQPARSEPRLQQALSAAAAAEGARSMGTLLKRPQLVN
jgi:hypothetical protein